jgi:hypothetical protein
VAAFRACGLRATLAGNAKERPGKKA